MSFSPDNLSLHEEGALLFGARHEEQGMAEEPAVRRTLNEAAARQLANATKTRAQWSGITPRWLVSFLPWTPVEAGIYRLNRVKEAGGDIDAEVECSPRRDQDPDLPETFVD